MICSRRVRRLCASLVLIGLTATLMALSPSLTSEMLSGLAIISLALSITAL